MKGKCSDSFDLFAARTDGLAYGGGFRAFAVADLLRSELAPANAATPARRCGVCDHWHSLLIGALGSHQFAIALWTLSLNHSLAEETSPHDPED